MIDIFILARLVGASFLVCLPPWFPLPFSHANFPNLQCDTDPASGARAAARVEFQSLVDMGACGASSFSAARSGALESDQSQSGAYVAAFATIAARRSLAGQGFPKGTEGSARCIRQLSLSKRHLRKNRPWKRDRKSDRLFFC